MKIYLLFLLLISCTLLLYCRPKKIKNDPDNITWYEKEKIRNIVKNLDGVYRIEIGISAQVFYLDSKTENANNLFQVLNYSFKNSKYIKIGIENNTNRILFAQKLEGN